MSKKEDRRFRPYLSAADMPIGAGTIHKSEINLTL